MVEIHEKLVEKIENRAREKKYKEHVTLIEKDRLTEQITYYGGLWLKEDISVEPAKLKTVPEKRLSLKIRLNFGKKVLEIKCCRSLFYMSPGGKIRPADELVQNLIKAINCTKRICNTPFEEPADIPLLLLKSQLNKQKAKFYRKAKEQKERDLQPPPCEKHCSMAKGKKANEKQRKSKKNPNLNSPLILVIWLFLASKTFLVK